jgi:hypothetical protein
MLEHVVLLGNSIFDNASYTKGLPDVVTHLRELLPPDAKASLLAVGGSTTADSSFYPPGSQRPGDIQL